MGKNCKVLGLAVNPMSERQISFLTSDGRVYMLDYLESKVLDEPASMWKTASQELVSGGWTSLEYISFIVIYRILNHFLVYFFKLVSLI